MAELRASILPSPAPGVQSHEGLLTTENTVPPELCSAPPPRAWLSESWPGFVGSEGPSLPGAARNLLTQAGPYWAGTMPRWGGLSQGPQAAARPCAQERRGDRLGLLKQRNLMAPSPQRGCLPPRAAGWGPLCRGTCFSLLTGRP